MKSEKRGFTLIELLVVIAIIGLLASIVLASLNSARKKARDARRMADLKQLQNALELYANDNGGNYPLGGGCAATTNCVIGSSNFSSSNGLGTAYMSSLPVDPLNSGANQYFYVAAATANPNTSYCLGVQLENNVPSGSPASTCSGASHPSSIGTASNAYSVGN